MVTLNFSYISNLIGTIHQLSTIIRQITCLHQSIYFILYYKTISITLKIFFNIKLFNLAMKTLLLPLLLDVCDYVP